MKVNNPYDDRSILFCVVDQVSGESQWHEIPPAESKDFDDYVVGSTAVEYGGVANPSELAAARELWAEANRAVNSRIASASASEGAILGRRQATVDVATGTATDSVDTPLAGASLKAAVDEANAAGAGIKAGLTADEKRDALASWQKSRGSSTPVDEFEVDEDGELKLDDDGQPIPVTPAPDPDVEPEQHGDSVEPVPAHDPEALAAAAELDAQGGGDHSGQDEDSTKGQE